jgi:peptidyl-tRNA hydrolase
VWILNLTVLIDDDGTRHKQYIAAQMQKAKKDLSLSWKNSVKHHEDVFEEEARDSTKKVYMKC